MHKKCLCDVYELDSVDRTSLTDELVLMVVEEDLIIESHRFAFASSGIMRDVAGNIKCFLQFSPPATDFRYAHFMLPVPSSL